MAAINKQFVGSKPNVIYLDQLGCLTITLNEYIHDGYFGRFRFLFCITSRFVSHKDYSAITDFSRDALFASLNPHGGKFRFEEERDHSYLAGKALVAELLRIFYITPFTETPSHPPSRFFHAEATRS